MQGASISLALGKSNLWLSGKGTAFISHALPLSSGAPVMADKVRLVNRQGLCAHLLLRCAVETAGVWAQCFLPPSPASELQLHGLKLPFETLKGPASWGHLCMLQQCLCGSWLALVPVSFKKKKFYAHCFLGCLPKFSHCWLQFRSDLLLALVAALKAAWGLQSVSDMVNDLSVGLSLWQAGLQAERSLCQRTCCRGEKIHKVPSSEAAESFHEVREISVFFSIFLKRSALGAFHSACPLFCAFFRETPQVHHALHAWDPSKQHKPQLTQSFSVEAVYCIR